MQEEFQIDVIKPFADGLEKLRAQASSDLILELYGQLDVLSSCIHWSSVDWPRFQGLKEQMHLLVKSWLASLRYSTARRRDYRHILMRYLNDTGYGNDEHLAFWRKRLIHEDLFQQNLAYRIIRHKAYSYVDQMSLLQSLEHSEFQLKQKVVSDLRQKNVWIASNHKEILAWFAANLKSPSPLLRDFAREKILTTEWYYSHSGQDHDLFLSFWKHLWQDSGDVSLKRKSALMLLRAGDFSSQSYLMEQLKDVELDSFISIWRGFEERRIDLPASLFSRFLKHSDTKVRRKMIEAIRASRSIDLSHLLCQTLWDQDVHNRFLSARSLSRFPEYQDALKGWVLTHFQATETYSKAMALRLIQCLRLSEYFPDMLRLLEHPELRIAMKAAVVLGHLQNPAAIPPLLEIVLDEVAPLQLRKRSCGALHKLMEKDEREQLPRLD